MAWHGMALQLAIRMVGLDGQYSSARRKWRCGSTLPRANTAAREKKGFKGRWGGRGESPRAAVASEELAAA